MGILFSRDLLSLNRFLKGQILDQSIVLETEFYCNKNSLLICFSNIFNRKGIKNITLKSKNYYNIENAIEKIKNFYKSFKDWFTLSKILPEISEVGEEKRSLKVAFITTVLPIARAGANFVAVKNICEFHGTIAAITPIGILVVIAWMFGLSIGKTVPSILSAKPE